VATFDLLGMTGNDWECWEVWPRVWDSLLYLFLVSSSDTCRQLSRWIGHDRSLLPRFRFHFIPYSNPTWIIRDPQDSFLENLLTIRLLLSQRLPGRSHFCQHRQLITRNCPDLRSLVREIWASVDFVGEMSGMPVPINGSDSTSWFWDRQAMISRWVKAAPRNWVIVMAY